MQSAGRHELYQFNMLLKCYNAYVSFPSIASGIIVMGYGKYPSWTGLSKRYVRVLISRTYCGTLKDYKGNLIEEAKPQRIAYYCVYHVSRGPPETESVSIRYYSDPTNHGPPLYKNSKLDPLLPKICINRMF